MKTLTRCLLSSFILLSLITTSSLLAQSKTRPGTNSPPHNTELQIGPVPGWTSAWYPAPLETAIPLGTTVQFQASHRATGTVTWTGARELLDRQGISTAECSLNLPGPHTVTMEYIDQKGELHRESSRLIVIDTSAIPVTLSQPKLWVDPVQLTGDAPNAAAIHHFFDESIANVRQLGENHFLTSTNRWFHLDVDVEPKEFAPLVEWRLNGAPQWHLGATIEMLIAPPREHDLEVGPIDHALEIQLQTYRVQITSHQPRVNNIPEGYPVTFTAITDPPGYESEITWLASTKFGQCEPTMGQGPEFTVSFRNTFGGDRQWLGVKADQATVSQDQKGQGTPCEADVRIARSAEDFIEIPVSSYIGSVAGNPENPYDVAGILHNALIDRFRLETAERLASGAEFSLDLAIEVARNTASVPEKFLFNCICCCEPCPCDDINDLMDAARAAFAPSEGLVCPDRPSPEEAPTIADIILTDFTEDDDEIRAMVADVLTPQEFAEFEPAYARILELSEAAPFCQDLIAPVGTPSNSTFYTDMLTLEEDVSTLTEPVRTLILPAAAIARYSAYDALSNCDRGATQGRVGSVVRADIRGCIRGAVQGGITSGFRLAAVIIGCVLDGAINSLRAAHTNQNAS